MIVLFDGSVGIIYPSLAHIYIYIYIYDLFYDGTGISEGVSFKTNRYFYKGKEGRLHHVVPPCGIQRTDSMVVFGWAFLYLLQLLLQIVTCRIVVAGEATTDSIAPTIYPSLSPHFISIITTIAGTGTAGYSGDGTQATSATVNGPRGIVIDKSGNVYFSEWNHRVRKITVSTGIITTYAGTGTSSFDGDGGVASSANLNHPQGLFLDTSGIFNVQNQ